MTERFTISLDARLAREFDALIRARGQRQRAGGLPEQIEMQARFFLLMQLVATQRCCIETRLQRAHVLVEGRCTRRLLGQCETQQQRVGAGPVFQKCDHLGGAFAVEQEVGVRGEQKLIVHTEGERFPEMLFGAIVLTENERELREAGQHPEPRPAAHPPGAGERVAQRRVSLRGVARDAVHRSLAADVVEGMAGSAQRLAGARRARVVCLHQQDRGAPEVNLRVCGIGLCRGIERVEGGAEFVPVLLQQRPHHEYVVGRVRSAPPGPQRGLGVADEARIAFRQREPEIAPGEIDGGCHVVGPRRRGASAVRAAHVRPGR